ncbi:MAG: helix-turn-helix transcriptional regulator [Ahniella sp.]|nr:helix-turn-helix transcriptional regulator [Ahniella sp.]
MARIDAFGNELKQWRQRRRLSQLELAVDAQISTRHLSFIETGRSRPSRGMVLHLAALLELPLRERNNLLHAAGFSPAFSANTLDAGAMAAAMSAVDMVLGAHGAFPAVAVDRCWNLLRANDAAQRLLGGVAPQLLVPPANVLRLTLHPEGLAPRLKNLGQLRAHLLDRLSRQVRQSGDTELATLLEELSAYPAPTGSDIELPTPDADVVVPLRLDTPFGVLSMFSTITVFGTPTDVTLSELAIETFYPADEESRVLLFKLAEQG